MKNQPARRAFGPGALPWAAVSRRGRGRPSAGGVAAADQFLEGLLRSINIATVTGSPGCTPSMRPPRARNEATRS